MDDIMIVFDRDGITNSTNHQNQLSRLFGVPIADIIGRHYTAWLRGCSVLSGAVAKVYETCAPDVEVNIAINANSEQVCCARVCLCCCVRGHKDL